MATVREGLYDSLLTARLAQALGALDGVRAQTHALDEADAPARLARFIAEEVRCLLAGGMTHLRRLAGQLPLLDDRAINRRFRFLLDIDDPARLVVMRSPLAASPIEQLMPRTTMPSRRA